MPEAWVKRSNLWNNYQLHNVEYSANETGAEIRKKKIKHVRVSSFFSSLIDSGRLINLNHANPDFL